MSIYSQLQNMVEEREPFCEDAINFRQSEDIAYLMANICKGLEIIDGVKFKYAKINDSREDIYQNKKTKTQLTKEEIAELKIINEKNKNAFKCKNSHYKLTSIVDSRYLDLEFCMEFTDSKGNVEEMVYHLYYPELVDGNYFLLNGNKFYPVFQLADAEYYRAEGNSIVLKTTFMPIKIRGNKTTLRDYNKELKINARNFELALFNKNINVVMYYFAKFGIKETIERFGIENYTEFCFGDIDEYLKDNDGEKKNYYFFKLTANIFFKVNKNWLDENNRFNESIINSIVSIFSRRQVNEENFYDTRYWMKQLGRKFTTNTSKAEEKAYSIIISVERLLDVTTKNNMRNPEEEKEDIFRAIFSMVRNFENIVRMDNHDLSDKRIRVAEYLLYPLTAKLSKSVYRLISSRNPPLSKLKQIFSSVNEDFIITKLNTITLIRFNNQVNTIDLFTKILKGSKSGPQSQKTDASSASIGIRGIHPSYLDKLDVTSTSSGDPGLSFTVTPFCKVYDPNNVHNFYFTPKSHIDDFHTIIEDEDLEENEVLVDDVIIEDDSIDEESED